MNLTREKRRNLMQETKVFSTRVTYDEIPTSAEAYQLMVFSPNTLILRAMVLMITPFEGPTPALMDVGIMGDAADSIMADVDLEGLAEVVTPGTNVVRLPTGGVLEITPTFTGAATTAGEFLLVIEYLEYNRVNGEQTNFYNG